MDRIIQCVCFLYLITLASSCMAAQCPSLEDLKNQKYIKQGWEVYALNQEKAKPKMVRLLTANATKFDGAYWNAYAKPQAQCFYASDEQIIQFLHLAQNLDKPQGKYWKSNRGRDDLLSCKSTIAHCRF